MKKIMIVDDSMIVRMNLKRIFERNGYLVVAEAANGKDAIEKYTKYHPDLTTMVSPAVLAAYRRCRITLPWQQGLCGHETAWDRKEK